MSLKPEQVEWIVNDIGELGVKIGEQCFFLYKGDSYVGGREYRPVGKREFGECCHPVNLRPFQLECFKGSHNEEPDLWKPIPNLPPDDEDLDDMPLCPCGSGRLTAVCFQTIHRFEAPC